MSLNNFLYLKKKNFFAQEMDSLIALLTILRYNPSLKSIDLSRPIPQYQYTNWMDEVAIHIAQMLEVIILILKTKKNI
jgi:protein tyrosine phosphatase